MPGIKVANLQFLLFSLILCSAVISPGDAIAAANVWAPDKVEVVGAGPRSEFTDGLLQFKCNLMLTGATGTGESKWTVNHGISKCNNGWGVSKNTGFWEAKDISDMIAELEILATSTVTFSKGACSLTFTTQKKPGAYGNGTGARQNASEWTFEALFAVTETGCTGGVGQITLKTLLIMINGGPDITKINMPITVS